MEGKPFSFLEIRRNLQSPPAGKAQAYARPSGLATVEQREPGTTASTASRSNPPLGVLDKDPENRKPLFNMLYTSQDKSRQALVPTGQRGLLNKKGGNGEGIDNGGRRKDTSEIEFSKSRSAIYGSRSPAGEVSRRYEHTAISSTPASPPTYLSNDEDVLVRRLAEHRSWQKELKVQIEKLGRAHDAALNERDLAQSDLSTVRSQLSNAIAVIADLRANNATGERRYAEACEKLADLQSTLASANSRIELLTTQSAEKDDENRQIREETRQLAHRVQDLRTSMEEQHGTFQALKGNHQTMTADVGELKSNVSGLRSATSEALEASKAMFNSDAWLPALRESRTVISELQGQLESSKEVVTILRDKLHHLASVLAEYKLQIEELETEKKASFMKIHQDYEELKTHYEHSASLEKKVEDLTERLVAREVETFDYLATSVGLEERLEAGKSEIMRLTAIISEQEPELASLRKSKEEHLERLLAAQEVTNAKDKELVAIRAEIKNMVESKEELRALLSEAKSTIAEKDQELMRRDPNPELEARVRELSSQLEKCHLDSGADKERLLESHHLESGKLQATQAFLNEANLEKSRLEEKLDEARTELACLRLDQARLQSLVDEVGEEKRRLEQNLDQARIEHEKERHRAQQNLEGSRTELACLKQEQSRLLSSVAEADKEKRRLEQNLDGARTELACLKQEQSRLLSSVAEADKGKRGLEQNLDGARTELACLKREQSRLRSLVDEERQTHQRKIDSDSISHKKLVEAQDMRAISAENAFKFSQKELATERSKIGDLTTQISALTSSLDQARTLLAEQDEALSRLQPTVHLADLQAVIDKLTIEKDELKEHADRILDRYHRGSLSDVEKDFVHHILHISESTHEQNLLEKDQEIRSRDNALAALQQRVKGLEKTLAKVLDDASRSRDARPIVNLKTLMTSSPKEDTMLLQAADIHPVDEPGKGEVVSHSIIATGPGTSFKQLAQMNSDSDDDLPLSELSSISGESGTNKKRVRLDSPPPPPPPAPPSAHSKRRGKNPVANKRGRPGASTTTEKAPHDAAGNARGRQVKRK